jgi:hypothetical protein
MATIAVRNPHQDSQIALYEFAFEHVDCPSGSGVMKWSRDQINDIVSLKCGCGLKVSFPQLGTAASVIADVSIDGDARELPADSFKSEPQQSVLIAAAAA